MQALAKTIRRYLPLIRNTFDHGLSNARVEATYTHLRVLFRRAYGFRPQHSSPWQCLPGADSAHHSPDDHKNPPTEQQVSRNFRISHLPAEAPYSSSPTPRPARSPTRPTTDQPTGDRLAPAGTSAATSPDLPQLGRDPSDRATPRPRLLLQLTHHRHGTFLQLNRAPAHCCHAVHPSQNDRPPTNPGRSAMCSHPCCVSRFPGRIMCGG
ncbi:transposase [Amycolatopsis sp. H20-H5]|uniref:transposase n=1 Tax=Amycolatopsis sp. H20-H5 TaxID=3046309 RepID=UPI003FA39BF9